MKKTTIPAIGLSILMLGTTTLGFAGCGKKSGKAETISKDSTWYDVSEIKFQKPEFKNTPEYISFGEVYFAGDTIVCEMDYDVVDEETMNYSYGSALLKYDSNGKLKSQQKLDKIIKTGDSEYVSLNSIVAVGDSVKAFLTSSSFNDVTFETTSKTYIYDIDTEELSEFKALDIGDGNIYGVTLTSKGDYAFLTIDYSKENADFSIIVADENSVKSETTVKELLGDENIQYVSGITSVGDDLVLDCYTEDNLSGMTRYSVNLDTKEYKKQEAASYYNANLADDGNEYYVTDMGVYKSEEKTDSKEKAAPVISFDDCNIRRSRVSGMKVTHMTDTECYMIGSVYSNNIDDNAIFAYKFTKADSNPNAGKKIVTAGAIDYTAYAIYDSVYEFNSKSEDYFVKITDKYLDTSDMEGVDLNSPDGYREYMNSHNSELVSSLSIDILGGDAPDVLFGAHSFIQLKNDKFLEDITPNMEKDLNKEDYFENVLDVCRTDDKLYFMPLSFSVEGIFAKEEDVGEGKTGFTFEEYKKFVDGPCNGNDPVYSSSRMEYFQEIYSNMSDLFYDGEGNIDLQNDAFYDLAKYCKDNVPESYEESEDGEVVYYGDDCYGDDSAPTSSWLYSYESYLWQAYSQGKKIKSFYGYPSADGRGPSIEIDASAAITATSSNKEGAWEFVKTLLSDEVQKGICEQWDNSISIPALRSFSEETLKRTNEDAEKQIAKDPSAKMHVSVYEESTIDDYIDALKSAKSYAVQDPAIMTIIDEEIQAYFAGQKDIEEVTETIQNRAKTVIDERG